MDLRLDMPSYRLTSMRTPSVAPGETPMRMVLFVKNITRHCTMLAGGAGSGRGFRAFGGTIWRVVGLPTLETSVPAPQEISLPRKLSYQWRYVLRFSKPHPQCLELFLPLNCVLNNARWLCAQP